MIDIQRMIASLKNKIFLLIGRCILTAIDNSGKTMTIKVTGLDRENISTIERAQEYGFESYPPVDGDSEAICGFINGNRDQGIVLCIQNREYRPTDLVEGESRMYYKGVEKITCKNGQIKIEGTKLNMYGASESYVKGDTFKTEFDKDIDAMTTLQNALNSWNPVNPVETDAAALKLVLASFLLKPMASSVNILSSKIKGE